MTAFLGKIGQWAGQYILKFLIKYVADFVNAFFERRRAVAEREKQDKKDSQENIPKYREAVKNGTEDEIDKATDSLLNS